LTFDAKLISNEEENFAPIFGTTPKKQNCCENLETKKMD
jgi:hypothetical protein